ncbi:hypothetical protein [Roseixanthobacter glucoisosaccharinicivorans]|uniref:hypothetical protein n=1 Tax=Roseixanthobacter glucoisosaccharinicivorans TaxID=3119923 RepID=UPI00372C94F0
MLRVFLCGMVRIFAHALRAIPRLAIRRMVAVAVTLCLLLGAFAETVVAHHVDDVDARVAMSEGALDRGAEKKLPDHGPSLPAADHDCHGCSAVVLDAPQEIVVAHVPTVLEILSETLVEGRVPGAELRPPRA